MKVAESVPMKLSGRAGVALRRRVHHAIVVGANGGVGRLVAEMLLQYGIPVSTVGRVPPGSTSWHSPCPDVAKADWTTIYAEAERRVAVPVDAIVFVAGDATFGLTSSVPESRAREVFEVNFWAPAQAATSAERLWERPRRGTFLSVSSVSARRGVPFEAHYCSSKAALARFLDALSLEHPDKRLRFLSVYPGRLRTAFRSKADWHGLSPDPAPQQGSDPAAVAQAILAMLADRVAWRVLGIRERAIDIVDRVSPALYDRLVLRSRVRTALKGRAL
jgi:short-subunit dehydrogenase